MARNLRIALTILSIGFALEGTEELYSLLTVGSRAHSLSLLFVFPSVFAVVGLAFVWVGQDEWNDSHRARTRKAGLLFVGSLVGGFVAVALLAVLYLVPALGTPLWAQAVFGMAVESLVFGTFLVCGYLVYHLASTTARFAVLVALAWSFAVAGGISVVLARNLSTIILLMHHPTVIIPAFIDQADLLVSYLFVSYFLLLGAYVRVHVAVARGPRSLPRSLGAPVRTTTSTPKT